MEHEALKLYWNKAKICPIPHDLKPESTKHSTGAETFQLLLSERSWLDYPDKERDTRYAVSEKLKQQSTPATPWLEAAFSHFNFSNFISEHAVKSLSKALLKLYTQQGLTLTSTKPPMAGGFQQWLIRQPLPVDTLVGCSFLKRHLKKYTYCNLRLRNYNSQKPKKNRIT